MTHPSQLRASDEFEASFLEDAYPGADFWEVENTFEVMVRVIAEAETPEEEPSVSFARSVLDKNLLGDVSLPKEISHWLTDYLKRHPEAKHVFDDMCHELVIKSGGKIAVDGATRGSHKVLLEDDRINLALKVMAQELSDDL